MLVSGVSGTVDPARPRRRTAKNGEAGDRGWIQRWIPMLERTPGKCARREITEPSNQTDAVVTVTGDHRASTQAT
jgi:hypothetical protein